jgi:hypothetical protein
MNHFSLASLSPFQSSHPTLIAITFIATPLPMAKGRSKTNKTKPTAAANVQNMEEVSGSLRDEWLG